MTGRPSGQQDALRKYLLRQLGETKEESIEMRLLADKAFGRLMAIAEDDLIDDFVSARLSESEMKAFRSHYLTTPERIQRVRFATALDQYASEKELPANGPVLKAHPIPPAARRWAIVLPVFALLLIVAAIGIFRAGRFRHRDYDDLRREVARLNQDQSVPPVAELRKNSPGTKALVLRHNLVREDADSRVLSVTPDLKVIRVLLELPERRYSSYTVALQSVAGEDLSSLADLKSRDDSGAGFVVVNLPASVLPRGDYQLKLFGIDSSGQSTELGLYPFQIMKN